MMTGFVRLACNVAEVYNVDCTSNNVYEKTIKNVYKHVHLLYHQLQPFSIVSQSVNIPHSGLLLIDLHRWFSHRFFSLSWEKNWRKFHRFVFNNAVRRKPILFSHSRPGDLTMIHERFKNKLDAREIKADVLWRSTADESKLILSITQLRWGWASDSWDDDDDKLCNAWHERKI